MSALIPSRPRAVTLNVRERVSGLATALNLHWAGLALFGVVNLYLLAHLLVLWQGSKSRDADAVARQEVALKTAKIAAQPLEGLDSKLKRSGAEAEEFETERLPVSYSEVAQELGTLVARDHVRLTRVQYAQSPVVGDAAGQLTEVRMDASLSGDYRALVTFLNGLERDRVFFLISGVTLTGQQTGTVNLRVRLVTYIRGMASEADLARVAVDAESSPTSTAAGGAR